VQATFQSRRYHTASEAGAKARLIEVRLSFRDAEASLPLLKQGAPTGFPRENDGDDRNERVRFHGVWVPLMLGLQS